MGLRAGGGSTENQCPTFSSQPFSPSATALENKENQNTTHTGREGEQKIQPEEN